MSNRSIVVLKLDLIYRSALSNFFSIGLRFPLRPRVELDSDVAESDSLPPSFGVRLRKGRFILDCREGLERGDFEDLLRCGFGIFIY
jgi:hypothetical protein